MTQCLQLHAVSYCSVLYDKWLLYKTACRILERMHSTIAGTNTLSTTIPLNQVIERCGGLADRRKLKEAAPRVAFYPKSDEKFASFCSAFPNAESFGESTQEGITPWRFMAGLSPSEVLTRPLSGGTVSYGTPSVCIFQSDCIASFC